MDMALRRFVFFAGIALLIALVSQAQPSLDPVPGAFAVGQESFTTTTPAKLYEGDPSHPGLADANPLGGLNGYCVDVQNEGNAPAPGFANLGFTVQNGTIVDTDAFTNDTATTTDDVYCVIVQSDADVTSMTIEWFFQSPGGFPQVTEPLVIEVFRVDLIGFDGFVGGRALVCTDGWDPNLLTGSTSNNFASQTEPLPDPLDKVVAADWSFVPGPPNPDILGDPFKEGAEWCIALSSSVAVADIDVSIAFDIVHNRATNVDDIAHVETGTDIVNIAAEPPFSELRHVNAAGQLIETQGTTPNAVGATHYACIIPSDADDTLNAADIYFGGTGTPGTVTEIFHNTAGRFPGVANGTLCFGFRATTPGQHWITLSFTKNDAPNPPEVRQVTWDVDGNCNDNDDDTDCTGANNALLKVWETFSHTVITRGNDPMKDIVTNSTVTEGIRFNVANGNWVFGGGRAISFTEWVLGPNGALLSGIKLEIRITSACGFFVDEDDDTVSLGKTIAGESVQGRFDRTSGGDPLGDGPDDFHISVFNDGACRPGESIQVEVDASTPGGDFLERETLTIFLTDATPDRTIVPILAWAGQTVTLPYKFAIPAGGACADETNTVHFVRSGGPGTFLQSPGLQHDGPDHLFGTFENCDRFARYESEDIGQVDIEVFVDGNPYSKVVFVIFYMAIEDVTTTATPELFVSERGDVSATVRGWFVNSNPSGRPAEIKDDGRAVPENRWVLPDDWGQLRGQTDVNVRATWPSTAPMPLTNVTFLMVNEEKLNSFAAGIFDGALGWFVLDGSESSINVNPRTGQPSALGSTSMPRIITDLTDGDGVATVDSFGDFNVGYADCEANSTGAPYCRVDDYVGSTLFYAVADYPGMKGKWAPVASNVAETRWLWAGYKELSIVDTDSPTIKYVVAHLRDRDGFCDAINWNNTLGIPVEFLIDGGEGKILEVAAEPSHLSGERKRAVGTTFDILDDNGNPINQHLALPSLSDDECQAWIKIANSVKSFTNVMVTFPANPVPIPSEVRITDLKCTAPESVTVTNFGSTPVSLAGFGINSRPMDIIDDWEHLGLIGLLGPGESKTFFGGPGAPSNGWIFAGDTVFSLAADFASLTWNGFELSRAFCDGTIHNPDLPATLPPSGEGEIVLDILVPFHEEVEIRFSEGWNLVTVASEAFLDQLLEQHGDDVIAVYRWDPVAESWERLFPNQPLIVSTLSTVQPGQAYWVQVKRAFTLRFVP